MKARIVTFLGLIVLLAGAFTFQREATTKYIRSSLQPRVGSPAVTEVIPDSVVYGFLFSKIVSTKNRTSTLQAQGRLGPRPWLPLQKEADLSEHQAGVLQSIASSCVQEINRQDEKAREIISAYRSQFPGDKIPAGVTPPPPPPELKVMWEERNAMVLKARDELRAAFGEQEFYRFDQHVKFRYGVNDTHRDSSQRNDIQGIHKP